MGLFFLKEDTIKQLGSKNEETIEWQPGMEHQIMETHQVMDKAGFTHFTLDGEYLMSSVVGWEE